MTSRARWTMGLLLLVAAVLLGLALLKARRTAHGRDNLRRALDGIQATRPAERVDCASLRTQQPLVLLVLGQSNAGNHGVALAGGPPAPKVAVMDAGVCRLAGDPLPGATGGGASLWSLLPAQLQARGQQRPVLLQLLAVDATSVQDWTDPDGPLQQRLQTTLAANAKTGLLPALVLWQQGEADVRAGTSAAHYRQGLQALAGLLQRGGVNAPILLAQSTVCRSTPAPAVRQAVQALSARAGRFVPGPDTDLLLGPTHRSDGCHFSAAGREAAASAWAEVINQHPASHRLRPGP